ncbi:MAG: carbohydrate kinase family protein [Lachnospiraceae bacterium]|nr:carbohydrate kinase family protein [Lachnospiraceae bacterium]
MNKQNISTSSCPYEGPARPDLVCIGTALVDSIIRGFDPVPVSASGFTAASGSLNVGGEAVNQAMAAAKLGLRTSILCRLGNDGAGSMVRAALEEAGVSTGLIIFSDDAPTPVTTMFVNEDGSRKSVTNGSHRYNFHPEKYMDTAAGARAVSLGSLFRAPFDDPGIIYDVLSRAAGQTDRGTFVFADTKLPNFTKLTLDDIKDSLPLIDYITPNEDEAGYYSGKDTPEEMADVFLDRGVKNVIVKLGAKGCYFKNADRSFLLPPYRIDAVDATGAGDNFMAGFIYSILNGSSDHEALKFANACGAICTMATGAAAGLKSAGQVLAFMKNNA